MKGGFIVKYITVNYYRSFETMLLFTWLPRDPRKVRIRRRKNLDIEDFKDISYVKKVRKTPFKDLFDWLET